MTLSRHRVRKFLASANGSGDIIFAQMTLPTGVRLGSYEILAAIGAGGMGEVYRARDIRLDRTVAIKVLSAHLSGSTEARQRFNREARAISSLSHPHICQLYDIGHQDGIDYLVMEFLEGETLAERLKKVPLPTEQMLKVAMQICEGLERAHKSGIVHRDLKPGNIMLTRSGAKLLDFGLAKGRANGSAEGIYGSTSGLTVTTDGGSGARVQALLTGEGTLLGTFGYMSPEQLEGIEADQRSDIFALGAVLYEMATGQPAFAGKTAASTIAAVLEREPAPIHSLRPMSPPLFDWIVKVCLAKDPDERWQTVHDVKLQLAAIVEPASQTGSPALRTDHGRLKRWMVWPAAAMLFVAGASAGGFGYGKWHDSPTAVSIHATVLPPNGHSFNPLGEQQFAVSPDGTRIALITAELNSGLWIHSIESGQDERIPGTDGADLPFWSPDSKSIGFFANGALKKVEAAGGPVVSLVDAKGASGAAWGANGTIVYAADFGNGGLRSISSEGGTATQVTRVDYAAGEDTHRWPFFLPDGRHVLFFKSTVRSYFGTSTEDKLVGVYLLDLKTGKQSFVVNADSPAQYAAGYLVFLRQQNLMAQRFDASQQKLLGSAQPVGEHIAYNGNFWAGAVSASGNLLAYMRERVGVSRLTWFDRTGREGDSIAINRTPNLVSLSPDGTRVATQIAEANGRNEICTFDLTRGGETRVTPGVAARVPIWTPDGRQITYLAMGENQIVSRASSGMGESKTIVSITGRLVPTSWSRDGKVLLYMNFNSGNGPHIYVHEDGKEDRLLLKTDATNGVAQFSPDGKWVAFSSNQTDRSEIYIVPFPQCLFAVSGLARGRDPASLEQRRQATLLHCGGQATDGG